MGCGASGKSWVEQAAPASSPVRSRYKLTVHGRGERLLLAEEAATFASDASEPRVLGFADLCHVGTRTLDDRQFTLTFEALVFAALARSEKVLGLPALGGLFAADAILELGQARLTNLHFMEAIFHLA
jgi:hypothetical protein